MIITRDKNGTTFDGERDLILLRRPRLFELKGQVVPEPTLHITNFWGYYRGDDWRAKLKATMAAIKFIWRRS